MRLPVRIESWHSFQNASPNAHPSRFFGFFRCNQRRLSILTRCAMQRAKYDHAKRLMLTGIAGEHSVSRKALASMNPGERFKLLGRLLLPHPLAPGRLSRPEQPAINYSPNTIWQRASLSSDPYKLQTIGFCYGWLDPSCLPAHDAHVMPAHACSRIGRQCQ
jgi:hypothetical protein